MKRIILALIFLVALCASAQATNITVSAFQPGLSWNYGSTQTITLRVYVSASFVTSDGVSIVASPVGGPGFYKIITCSLSGTTLTVNSFVIPSTTDATPTTARYTFIFFQGSTKRDVLWSNYQVPVSLGTTITNSQLEIYNRTAPAPPRPGFPTTDQVQQLINAVLPAPKSSTTTNGIGKVSVNPVDATNPIFVGDPDPRVNQVFNVKASPYNAVGDGATNDTTAIQAALTAAGVSGGTVFIPDGRFFLTASLTVSSNTRLIGNGYASELFFQNAAGIATGVSTSSASHVEIGNLRVTGSSTATLSRGIYIVSSSYVRVHDIWQQGATFSPVSGPLCGICANASTDVEIDHDHVTGNGYIDPIPGYPAAVFNTSVDILNWIDGSPTRINIHHNTVKDSMTAFSIQIANASDSFVNFNIVDQGNKIGTLPASSGYGISLYQTAGTPVNVHVEGNTIKNCAGSGIYVQSFNKVTIANNIIETPGQQQTTASLPVAGVAFNMVNYSSVTGNIIISSTQAGIWMSTGVFNTVVGNTMWAPGLDAMRLSGISNSTVGNNTIDSPVGIGIYSPPVVVTITAATNASPVSLTSTAHVLNTGDRIVISGGTGSWVPLNAAWSITKTGVDTFTVPLDTSAFGAKTGTIIYSVPLSNVTIIGNRVKNSGATAISLDTMTYSSVVGNSVTSPTQQGIAVTGDSTNNSITGNNVAGITTNRIALLLFGTKNTVNANNFSATSATGSTGIDTASATDTKVDSNTITGFSVGAYDLIPGGTRNIVTNNQLVGNTAALTPAASTIHYGNQFTTGPSNGQATLGTNGTVTVNTAEIKTGDYVSATPVSFSGTAGIGITYTINDGVSIVFTARNADGTAATGDRSTFGWMIHH